MKKNILLIALFLITTIYAQNIDLTAVQVDKAITPTASVTSLGSYGDKSGVDNKGKYNTSIDLTTLKSGNLSYNMGISYSSNGLKLNEWGGRVGLLWSNNFTSAIYRTVRGLPDEYMSQKVTGLSSGGYTLDQYHLINEMVTSLENNNTSGKDGESDLFNYNIFGLTGSFTVVNGQVLQVNYTEKLKIEVGSGFSTFIITLKNGDKYYYGNDDTIEYTTYDTQCQSEMAPFPKQKTAWFLTKIEDANATNTINFTYGNISNYYTEDKSESITIKNKKYAQDIGCYFHDWQFLFYLSSCTRYKVYDTKYLTKVSSLSFNVNFLYTDREDLKNEKLLDLIEIRDLNNSIVNKVKFDYQKFGQNVTPANQSWGYPVRYFLNKVSIGKDLGQKYTFLYKTPDQLPQRFAYAQDITGIYNGVMGTTYLPNEFVVKAQSLFAVPPNPNPITDGYQIPTIPSSDRTPHFPQSSFGLLSTIQFPTGGKEKIFYEPNTVVKDAATGNETEFYGVRTKKIEIWNNDTDFITKEYKYNSVTYDSIDNNITFGTVSSLYSNDDEFGGHLSNGYNWGNDTQCHGVFDTFYCDYYYKINSNKIYDINRFQGDFIAYTDITEVINGKKFSIKKYNTVEDWFTQPVWGVLNSYSPNSEYFWYANILSTEYEGEIINNIYNARNISEWGYTYKDYQMIENFVVGRDYLPPFHFADSHYTDNLEAYYVGRYIYPNRWYNNFKKSETIILDSGAKLTQQVVKSYFDAENFNNLRSVTNTSSEGNTDRVQYNYAKDLYGTGDLVQKYMIGIPLVTTNYHNNVPVSKIKLSYGQDWLGHEKLFPLTKASVPLHLINTASEVYEPEITYDQYDKKGNLLQYTTKEGIPVTIIYGYKQTLPILKVEGISYISLMDVMGLDDNILNYNLLDICQKSDIDNDNADNGSEESLIQALDNVRQNSFLATTKITTYTYDPIVGLTSKTTSSGIREKYVYDPENNRLKEIKILEKNSNNVYVYKTTKAYNYHYKN